MKITTKDLHEWSCNGTAIRYRGGVYHLMHNGRTWLLRSGETIIPIYHKSRGIYGLETNKN